MLDTLLSRLKEEIAIDGPSGSSIDAVWKYAESISNQVAKQSNVSITPKIDGPYKAFIWNYIKQEPELEFFEEVVPPAEENQTNSDDVPMEEQQGTVDQDQLVIAIKKEATEDQDGDVITMDVFPDVNDTDIATEEAQSEDLLIDMLQEAQKRDRKTDAVNRKRKMETAVKKPVPKKKKMKSAPKKKAPKKKRVSAGHSDSDFEMDSDDSESEYDESDLSEVSSEEYSTEGDEDVSDQDDYGKSDYVNKYPTIRRNEDILSNPRNVQQQTRKNNADLTAIQDIADLSYDQVQERYGSSLRIIASARLQDEQLYLGIPPNANITSSLVVILREIIKTRTKGLYQASITRLLNLDSRSTGHYVKSLEDKGAITRRGVSINSMYTNICVHARYSIKSNAVDMNTVGDKEAENELPYNVNGHGKVFSQKTLLDAMVDLALAAPNGLILAQDVLHGLGFNSTRKPVRKWFNRSIDELCLKGYFEKASIKLDGSRQHRCLHLLKVPEDYEATQASNEQATVPVDELSFPIQIKTTKNQGIPIHHLLCDVPLESQILDVITAAGTHGVVQKDISIALNSDEMRFLSKALEKLSELKSGQGYEQYGIVRHFEFEGRIKRYRYFTLAASIKVNEDIDYIPPPLPSTEVDESKYYERAIFNPVPHTMASLARYRKMVKKAGHRNVIFKEDVLPKSRKQKLNRDDTPRTKSRYLLQKEKKIAEMLAAENAAAEGSTNTTSNSTVGPSSTATSSDQPPKAPTTKEIHSFFRANRQARIRKSDMHLIRSPSPTPVPAPIISQERLACPAPAPKVRPAPPIETPARKKRKYTKKNAATQVQAVQDGTSISEAEAQSTEKRTTRSGRVIPYEYEPATSSTTPSEAQSDSPVAFESSTQIDTPPSASSEPAQPDGHTATEEPDTSTAEGHVQATQSEASASKSPPQSSSPAGAARPEMKSKRKSSPAPVKSYQPRRKNRSIADYFKLTPKTTIPSVAANASAEASSPTVTIPPVEATPTKAKTKETKTVRFAETTPECASESEQSSSNAVTEANPETTARPSEAMKGAVEESTSKDHTEQTTATDSDDTAQADVANMEVDKSELGHPAAAAAAAAAAINEVREDGPSADAMRTTCSRSSTATPAPVVDQTSVTTTGAEESRLFRRYQHEKMHKPVNSYLEARVKILYELLDELRLVEMGNGLAQEFSERAAAQNKNSKYKMDNKTLWTTALELEKRGQAQTTVVECTLLSGKTVYRKVVFHRDMSRDSEEFKTCISFIKERRTGISYRNMPKPIVEVDQVVRLSDQVEQMQKEAQELLMSGQVKKAKQLELRISELSGNLETFGRTYGKMRSAHWMIEAVQYGWINACMARAKVFHRYLFRLLEANVKGVDQETRIISVKAVCDNMTFQLLAQVIGIFKPTRLIAEFYKDVNNHKVKMADMSDELKHDLFDENTKFLRRLRRLFNYLEFLQVVSSQFTEVKNNPNFKASKYSHIAPSYKLERTLPIIDRKQAEEPVLREYTIDTMDDLNDYWTDLKYVSLVRDTDKSTLKELDDPYEIDLRTSLHSSRNWSTRAMFSRSQRKLLNEKVDKANRKTPLNDIHEIRNLANKINMPIATVQAYYEKVEAALERRLRYSKEKKLERLLLGGQRRRRANKIKYNVYSGRRVLTGDSNHAFVAPRRQPSKAGKSYLDDLQDLPVVQGDVFKSLIKRRRKRSVWTTQDDEILLYLYIILRHRSRQNKAKLSWIPAQKVFPDREPQTCRHRKDRMVGQSVFSEKYELYLVYWDAFYREGIANGDITDADPGDNINLDILSYIEYFVQRLQELDAHPIDLPLYKTLAQTNEMYDIARNEASSPYFEDAFHDGESLVHKLQTLCQAPLTLRKCMNSRYDQSEAVTEDDATNRLCNVIRAYCLMTLMTPAEVFDPFHAYQILAKFSPQLMDVVFERMKAEKTLILAYGDRPIPGTCWALSAKFIKNMSGELPVDLFNQATEYEKFLATQNEKFKFMPYHASSGMMACLLNALSDDQVSFGLANLSLQLRKVNEVGFKTRGVGYSVLTQLGVTIQRNNQANQAITAAPTSSKIHIKNVTNKEYDATLSNLLISQSDKESALIKAVIHALHEQHEVGLTLYQLKMKLQEHHHRFKDHDIIKTVRKLCYNKPALVCRVGFDAVRYVHIKFIDSWTINNKKAKDYKLTEKAREEVMSQTNGQFQTDVVRKDIVIPSLWIDINGNVTELVLNGCKKAILDLVLRKPGITEADIHRHMVTGLSKREIHDVLDILVEEQALKCIQVQIIPQKEAKQSSIFAKKTVVKCSSTDTIGKLTHSCFWVTPKIFSSTI
ncbi:DNA-dependent RNA polymerase II [Mucor velutinosus]|uniref:DNA-dependent RNA polymerase II n=1 Tax=Mucor velutinosus TaxID=708070 RepID=A0AAN7HWI4_9FUNG|nr:DNA-dependent RNA polymerase II [Mucor velutinosus]